MTTYFPSFLLMLITFATTFFKPFFFEAALSVNLTTMLVMTTIFISKMEGLPPTSDTKMIDYWLILCQLVPFAQVVLITAMEYLREEDNAEDTLDTKKQTIGPKELSNLIHVSAFKETLDEEDPQPADDDCHEEVKSTSVKMRANAAQSLKFIGNIVPFLEIIFPQKRECCLDV